MKTFKNLAFVAIVAILGIVGFIGCGGGDDDGSTTITFTVTFNSNGGTTVTAQTVTKGDKAKEPAEPTKTSGYDCIFVGWYDQTLENAFDFDTPVTKNTVLYAKWKPYELGDTGPGGGKIFYRSVSGFTMTDDNSTAYYLEAAPANMLTQLAWASSAFIPPEDGGTGNYVDITGTETAIGTGRKNTALILATDTEAPAAKACNEYSNNGKTDWFLPSKDELNEIYVNRESVGNLPKLQYWSSSQYNSGGTWDQSFHNSDDGDQSPYVKYGTDLVRAVRAF